jgi:hypothetical protein
VSVYGLGRFPVTQDKEQWTKLLDMADEIRAFIREHEGELKIKKKRRRESREECFPLPTGKWTSSTLVQVELYARGYSVLGGTP